MSKRYTSSANPLECRHSSFLRASVEQSPPVPAVRTRKHSGIIPNALSEKITNYHQFPLLRKLPREVEEMNYRNIITIEPGKRSGEPCIRGMRITVYDVLEYLASGMTNAQILCDFPELTETDIRACLAYAADREKSQMVVYTHETSIRSESVGPVSDSTGESVS